MGFRNAAAMGAMNLHGTVIPVVDLAARLGSLNVGAAKRNAIVVTNVNGRVIASRREAGTRWRRFSFVIPRS